MPGPRDYSTATRAALAALSRRRCYFPACNAPIFRFIDGEPYIDYQIAHIRDAAPGNRYDARMTDDDRRSFNNLILLCKPHHELVDKRHVERYTAEDLEGWKVSREGGEATSLSEIGPITETDLEDLLQQSVAESQEQVTDALREHDLRVRHRVERMRKDASYATVRDALEAMSELRLLSSHGVRATTWLTDFYLRVQMVPGALRLHLDTRWEPSVFVASWLPDESLTDVLLRLAEDVRPTAWWPGAERWEFATAINDIVDTLLLGLQVKANGGWIRNAVQSVGDDWLLSDREALGVSHDYQILFSRLDVMDWYHHLRGKGWTDRTEVSEMLEQAAFLRALALTEYDEDGYPLSTTESSAPPA